ncbi:ABC transporter permease subunit [Oceanobacillus sp. CAU 1775]
MKTVFTKMLSILGLGLLVIILGDSMVREKEQQTIRTLSTQPITSSRLLFGKLIGNISAIIYMLIIIVIACFAIPLIFGGSLGNFSYPQLIYTSTGFEFIPISEYLMLYILLFFGAASFLLSIILLLSVLFNDRLTVIFFSLLTLFGGVAVTAQFAFLQSVINPFYYFQFQQLIEYREQLVHPFFIILPYVVAILIVILSSFLLKRKRANSTKTQNNAPFKNGTVHKRKKYSSITTIFEWRKYLREGIVKRFSIIILFLIVVGYVVIAFQTHQLEEHYISSKQEQISGMLELKSMREQNKENNEKVVQELESKTTTLSENEKLLLESAKNSIIFNRDSANLMVTMVEKLEHEVTAYQREDWKTVYDYWIEELMLWWEDPQYNDNTPTKQIDGGQSDFTYLASVKEKDWLNEHQIEPVFIKNYTPYTWTIYDEYISPIDQFQWNQDTRKVSDTGLFYVYTFFTTPSYLILYVLLLFILGAGMATEKSDRRTIALLQTQPLRLKNIYFGKTFVSMLITGIIASLSVLSMVLIGTLVNRFGDWKFPIVHYDPPSLVGTEGYTGFVADEGGFHFMYMGDFLLGTGALFLAGILFLLALSLFLSLFFKNTMTVFVTTIIVAAGGYVLSTLETFSAFARWLPFTYLDIGKIANGQMAAVLGNEGITTSMGILSLIGAIVILLVAGGLKSLRK